MTNLSLSAEAIQKLLERNDPHELLRAATRLRKWLGDVRELVHELEVAIGELERSSPTTASGNARKN